MYQRLPLRGNLEHLRKEAKAVLRIVGRHRDGWRLADAQHAVARGYGFLSWSKLKAHVQSVAPASASAGSRIEAGRHAIGTDDTSRHEHPIAGTWIASRTNSTQPRDQTNQDVMSVVVAGDVMTFTHVTLGRPGNERAQKMAIRADGQEHPLESGGGEVLQAHWINVRVLEVTLKRGGQTVARGQYELAEDGTSLTVSTTEQVVVFERA